jgi:membrane-associated phospholipid phosphatase
MSGRALEAALARLARRGVTRPAGFPPFLQPAGIALVAVATAALIGAFAFLDPVAVAWQRGLAAWLVHPFRYLTHLGLSGVILWPVGIAIVVLALLYRQHLGRGAPATIAALEVRLALIFVAVAVPSLLATILKRLIGRVRPPMFETQGHLAFEPIGWNAIAQGFPSGHATTAFAAAVVLGVLFPRVRTPLFVLAGLIALSRVVLGSHYASDAIGGALLGTLVALLIVRAFAARRLGLRVSRSGTIAPMAWPSARRLAALAAAIRDALRGRSPRDAKRAADESI